MFSHLGKFEIIRSLGQGAMGEVFLARDPAIGREVAVKTILTSSSAGEGAKERFAREAKAAGTLNHPGIVTIHEFGEDQGVLYLAMEFVEGDDLHDLLMGHELSKTDLLEVLAQVSEALAYAHRKGVVHRDVKPSNVRVSREGNRLHAKLMDFGIARISESTLTSAGMLMGTVAYMAPEYVKTGHADGRADLFAVGVMLYEGLSGQLPFAGDTTATILYKLVHEPPRPLPPSALHGASPAIRGVLDRILDKDPDRRHANGEVLAASLREAKNPSWTGEGTPTLAVPRPHPMAAAPPSRKAWMATAAAVLLAGVGTYAWRHLRTPVTPSSAATPPQAASEATPTPMEPPRTEVKPAPEAVKSPPPPVVKQEVSEPPKADFTQRNSEAPPADAPPDPAQSKPNALAAAALIDRDPAQAHRDLMGLIQAEPRNSHLRALDLTALAKSGDNEGFVAAWDAALQAGMQPTAFLFTPRFATMLREQKQNRTLSDDAMERVKAAYGNQEQRRGRWRRN